MSQEVISGISSCFQLLFQSQGQVAHVLLTRSPLEYPQAGLSVRLACVKHAASVRPEPGSNSPLNAYRHRPRKAIVNKNRENAPLRPNRPHEHAITVPNTSKRSQI